MKSKELKYIIVTIGPTRERAIVFDKDVVHSMAYEDKSKIISAGFCQLKFDGRSSNGLIVDVWGKSLSLGLESRELDKNLIYQSLIVGVWDYFLDPDDPMADEIQKKINEQAIKDEL